MEEIVIDASVVAKWYIDEELRDYALKIRDNYIDGRFVLSAPSLMPFEVLNAARYARKDITFVALSEIAQSLSLYGIRLHNLQGEYSVQTVKTAMENGITIYDASYLALARHLKTVLFTSDQDLIASLKQDDRAYVRYLGDYTAEGSRDH